MNEKYAIFDPNYRGYLKSFLTSTAIESNTLFLGETAFVIEVEIHGSFLEVMK